MNSVALMDREGIVLGGMYSQTSSTTNGITSLVGFYTIKKHLCWTPCEYLLMYDRRNQYKWIHYDHRQPHNHTSEINMNMLIEGQ